MITSAFIIISLLSGSAFATNDWSVPCFDGECSYDSDSGSLRVWGSPAAIADITKVAGWSILDCDPQALEQDIRLVCNNPETCNTLWDAIDPVSEGKIDPVGKLVRLPESCGANAFARIGRIWVHNDQSIPDEVRRSLVRRDGEEPLVRGLTLDTNFAATDPAQTGNVNIAIQGANIPGQAGDAQVVNTRRAARIRQARGLFDFIENAFNKFNKFDKEITKELPPVDLDKTFNLIDQSLDCPASGSIPAFTASIKADVTAKAHAVVSIGIAAEGTIIPPHLSTFGAFAGLNADFTGTLAMKGSASGTADTGKVTFFETGLPGLDFPGILTLGPSFKIQGQALATLDVGVNMQIDLTYSVKDAKLFFPKSETQQSGGGFTSNESPLKLSVTPSVSAKGTVEAHLIPVVDMGITALGGIAKATVFLNLDARAGLTLTLEGQANASVDTNGATAASAGVSGCVDIGGGLSVNAGADASFFSLFDKNTQVALFQKDFQFFKKCFSAATKRNPLETPSPVLAKRFNFACPTTADFTKLVPVADEKVAAQTRRSLPRYALVI